MGAEAFGFAPPPPEEMPPSVKYPVSCGYELEGGEVCPFTGFVFTSPVLYKNWTCPLCGGLHEADPDPGLHTEKEED